MEVIRAFRNLDRHGQQRAPEIIEEEVRQLEPHLVDDATLAETADLLGLSEAEVEEIAEKAGETLRRKLVEAGLISEASGRAPIEREIALTQRLPQPVEYRRRVAAALAGAETNAEN